MPTRIRKWGNSQGLRLPKNVLEEARVDVGDEVDLVVRDGAIVIEPVRKHRGRHRLEELVARIPEDYEGGEVSWGGPVGREDW
ncbi:MAG: AbrB/MazE/SpoVT family DNA-binding domain-containing protein [Acidobacteria bacterium]|nr:AbrB/MazE/SpoVT family DNA-binding domain-containing protein [Acidobacteriota bacterium]